MSPKYPRTFHLPWSPGATSDDKRMASVDSLLNRKVVLSEKMDGSNVCLEAEHCFARSHASAPAHPSFDALKALHAQVRGRIGTGVQVFGEWCWAQHSIHYDRLPGFLLIFGVREGSRWASWEEVELWAEELEVPTVPVLESGVYNTHQSLWGATTAHAAWPSTCGPTREGVVVRWKESFEDDVFTRAVGKYVRANHVTTDEHWKNQAIIRNRCA